MAKNPIVIFGAGATKACGGPLTSEILPNIFAHKEEIEREGFIELLNSFLKESFHVPTKISIRKPYHYPPLPLLLSLIDISIDRKQPLGSNWDSDKLINVRDALEYGIFALLEYELRRLHANWYWVLLDMLTSQAHVQPNAISLNYDIIVDNTIVHLIEEKYQNPGFPDYGCDIATLIYQELPKHGMLMKLHGSLNWLYCPGCHRLDIGISDSGRSKIAEDGYSTIKVLEQLYHENPLEPRYGCHGSACLECGTFVRPVLITPTQSKDYRNPHISQVWYKAERLLREADRAIIVGYSLPEDDINVIYLLKRGLSHLDTSMITVVEFDKKRRKINKHPVGLRYRSLFGDGLDWRTEGLEAWLQEHTDRSLSPLDGPLPD